MTKITEAPKLEQRHFDALAAAVFDLPYSYIETEKALRELPALIRELVAENERLDRECEIRYHELKAERAKNEHAINLLSAIHMRIYPKLVAGPDGKTYQFTAPDPHLYLQALADCIRAIPDELVAAASPQAPAVPDDVIQEVWERTSALKSQLNMRAPIPERQMLFARELLKTIAAAPQPAAVPDVRQHVVELLEFIFNRFGQPGDAGELTDKAVAAVRGLEKWLKSTPKGAES